MRDQIFKFIDSMIEAVGLRPIVFIVKVNKHKNEPMTVLNTDYNLKCAMNFFESHDETYEDCAIILGLRKKNTQ